MGSVTEPTTAPRTETVPTGSGDARITWYEAGSGARFTLALGHGAGGGVQARDLQALAARLPAEAAAAVALVEQPWRVAGKKLAPAPKRLDEAWRDLWPALRAHGLPVIAGGRSAGARVACRTAPELEAHAVLALAFPLHPPGKPESTRADELLGAGVPTLVVQGGNDSFGKPEEFPEGDHELVAVPFADHGFAVPKRATVTQEEALDTIVTGVAGWLRKL